MTNHPKFTASHDSAARSVGSNGEDFEKPAEGEWVQPIESGYRMRCCDCKLTHRMDFRVYEGRAQFRVFREDGGSTMVTIEQSLFEKVHEAICNSRCPSVKETSEQWKHGELCEQMAAANGGNGPRRGVVTTLHRSCDHK